MNKPLVFMFSGQGSHYYQMGRKLFDSHPVFRDWMAKADRLVNQWLRLSIIDEVYRAEHKRSQTFDKILYTHPAIVATEYAIAQVLNCSGIHPSYLLGASLGEISAATVAGAIGFEKAIELVCKQAKQLNSLCSEPGGMVAVLGPPSLYEENPLLSENTTLAAINGDRHFVIAGSNLSLRSAEKLLRDQGVAIQRLAVNHGFHGPEIDLVEPTCRNLLEKQTYSPPATPLIFCSVAGRVDTLSSKILWGSARSPIRFQDTVRFMEKNGDYIYLDLGPSGTLSTLVKYNLAPDSASITLPILTPFGRDLENLAEVESMVSSEPR